MFIPLSKLELLLTASTWVRRAHRAGRASSVLGAGQGTGPKQRTENLVDHLMAAHLAQELNRSLTEVTLKWVSEPSGIVQNFRYAPAGPRVRGYQCRFILLLD